MHIAAARPTYAAREGVPPAALAAERALQEEQAASAGKGAKTPAILAKIVEGRLAKFYSETVLLEQPYILAGGDSNAPKVQRWLAEAAAAAGAPPVRIAAFAHFVVGEAPAPAATA